MKLLRVGDFGHEKVAALDANNIMRDLSSHIEDLNPETINFDNLKKLEQIKLEPVYLLNPISQILKLLKKLTRIALKFIQANSVIY